MQILRVMIAALDPGPVSGLLRPENTRVIHAVRDGRFVAEAVGECRPDLLILQSELPGTDGFSALEMLSKRLAFEFPYTVLMLKHHSPAWEARAMQAGADAALRPPLDGAAMEDAIRRACAFPLPRAALPTESARRDAIRALIDMLNAPEGFKGRDALIDCVNLCVAGTRMRGDFSHLLYPAVGARLCCSPAAVEKNIRTLIESVWLSGDLSAIQRLFGFSVDAERGKPTNRECVLMLAQHAMNALRR